MREQIREIVVNYFTAIDGKDIEGLMNLFSEDAVLIGFGETFEGKDAIKNLWEYTFTELPNMKHVFMHPLVEVKGKVVTVTCRWMWSADGTTITIWGHDEFVFGKEGAIWKILELKIIPD